MLRRGSDAEDRAADLLLGLGYTIVTRRFKGRSGEIDLIALDGEMLVFVEVKSRSARYVPEESIGSQKISRLWATAEQYRFDFGELEREFRFDVVAFEGNVVRHHVDVLRN